MGLAVFPWRDGRGDGCGDGGVDGSGDGVVGGVADKSGEGFILVAPAGDALQTTLWINQGYRKPCDAPRIPGTKPQKENGRPGGRPLRIAVQRNAGGIRLPG